MMFSPGPYVEATVVFVRGGFGQIMKSPHFLIWLCIAEGRPDVTIPEINKSFIKCLRVVS